LFMEKETQLPAQKEGSYTVCWRGRNGLLGERKGGGGRHSIFRDVKGVSHRKGRKSKSLLGGGAI